MLLSTITFHAGMPGLQVHGQILWARLHKVSELGDIEGAGAIAGAATVDDIEHGDAAADEAVVAGDAAADFHPPVVRLMHHQHLIQPAGYIERLELAVLVHLWKNTTRKNNG